MPFYLSNDSYPELRDLPGRWARHRLWWRAFRSGVRDWRLVLVALVQMSCGAAAALMVLRSLFLPGAGAGVVVVGFVVAGLLGVVALLALSIAGDLVRPHLRRASETARHACPNCGHSLRPQIDSGAAAIRCGECGMTFDRTPFEPPFRIPTACRRVRLGRRAKA